MCGVSKGHVVDDTRKVKDDPLDNTQVWLSGVMHVETNMLDCIYDVGPSESKVLKSVENALSL
jgi:hypothetical protein